MIGSILRKALRTDNEPLNIATWCTHERYEQNLAKTGHNFWSLRHAKEWDTAYGLKPNNYRVTNEIPPYVDIDLILCQTMDDKVNQAMQLSQRYNAPIVQLCHVLPDIRQDVNRQKEIATSIPADHFVFISDFNKNAWGFEGNWSASVVNHGISPEFTYSDAERSPHALSAVNLFADRDWCCGWEVWQQVASKVPVRLIGKNPGMSEALSGKELVQAYQQSQIFFNTSTHSPVPTVLMEAMACGCAIVSTTTCMIPEIITNGENGLFADSPIDMVEAIQSLLDNPERARELGKAAAETIKTRYNVDEFVNNWKNTFRRCVTLRDQ